jgi:hypothetical protein
MLFDSGGIQDDKGNGRFRKWLKNLKSRSNFTTKSKFYIYILPRFKLENVSEFLLTTISPPTHLLSKTLKTIWSSGAAISSTNSGTGSHAGL